MFLLHIYSCPVLPKHCICWQNIFQHGCVFLEFFFFSEVPHWHYHLLAGFPNRKTAGGYGLQVLHDHRCLGVRPMVILPYIYFTARGCRESQCMGRRCETCNRSCWGHQQGWFRFRAEKDQVGGSMVTRQRYAADSSRPKFVLFFVSNRIRLKETTDPTHHQI